MKTRKLQQHWWDWLSTAERLQRSLNEQTQALVRRDVAQIERLQPELDSMLDHMRSIDEEAAAVAKKLAEELGAEPNLRGLVAVLPKAEALQVSSISNRVKAAAANVAASLDKNRKLIDNELLYVGGTLALIAKAAQEQQCQYGSGPEKGAVLVDQVA